MGSKPKFWFLLGTDEQPWLFKYARETAGEDWSEKIAAEVAVLLNVPAAQVELAEIVGKRGCASHSFVQRKKGFGLIHGSEILAGRVLGYDKDKKWKQSDHSLENIFSAVEGVFAASASEKDSALKTLAGFIVLDAVICNVDRHHDNWGILRGPSVQMAPSYDHASSLGRELLDEKRADLLKSDQVGQYVLKGSGGIYWKSADKKGENPLLLAINASRAYPAYFEPWIQRIKSVKLSDVSEVVQRVPEDRMSRSAKDFCLKMMETTMKKLGEVNL